MTTVKWDGHLSGAGNNQAHCGRRRLNSEPCTQSFAVGASHTASAMMSDAKLLATRATRTKVTLEPRITQAGARSGAKWMGGLVGVSGREEKRCPQARRCPRPAPAQSTRPCPDTVHAHHGLDGSTSVPNTRGLAPTPEHIA